MARPFATSTDLMDTINESGKNQMHTHGITKLRPGSATEALPQGQQVSPIYRGCDGHACLSPHSSIPLDDKNRLIVNTILLANLSQAIVSFERVVEQCIADVFCRQPAVVPYDAFK